MTHLENDLDQSHEKQIIDALNTVPGVEAIQIDETLPPGRSYPDPAVVEAQLASRRLIDKSAVFVLVWGAVEQRQGKVIPNLYWTETARTDLRREAGSAVSSRLPGVPWGALGDLLRLEALTATGSFKVIEQPYLKDRSDPLFDRVRQILTSSDSLGLDQDSRFGVLEKLAWGLLQYGIRGRLAPFLEEAASLYDSVLKTSTLDRSSYTWKSFQLKKGTALLWLGKLQTESLKPLESACETFRSALTECSRDKAPGEWAATQSNLGSALCQLGLRLPSRRDLDQSVAACDSALQIMNRDSFPMEWAINQSTLGDVYLGSTLLWGDRQAPAKAISAYSGALEIFTIDWTGVDWATVQNSLGQALSFQGQLDWSGEWRRRAVDAHREALRFWKRYPTSPRFALTEYYLGKALEALTQSLLRRGEMSKVPEVLMESIESYQAALKVYTPETSATQWAIVQRALGDVCLQLCGIDSKRAECEKGVAAYQAALSGFARGMDSLWWAGTQAGLAEAQITLLAEDSALLHTKAAIAASRAALRVYSPTKNPHEWTSVQSTLAKALLKSWVVTGDPNEICEAFKSQLLAWEMVMRSDPRMALYYANMVEQMRVPMEKRLDAATYQGCLNSISSVWTQYQAQSHKSGH